MKFKKATTGHSAIMHISGKYEVVKCGNYWYAFVKEHTSTIWGTTCFRTPCGESQEYKTMEQAQKACEDHSKGEV